MSRKRHRTVGQRTNRQ